MNVTAGARRLEPGNELHRRSATALAERSEMVRRRTPFRRRHQFRQRESARPQERVLARITTQPSPNRVQHDVLRDRADVVFISERIIPISVLPQPTAGVLAVMKSRRLPKYVCTPSRVRVRPFAFTQNVEMVGHEAVRDHFNHPVRRTVQKLGTTASTESDVGEPAMALERAHRDENRLCTEVAVFRKTRWSSCRHARDQARVGPARLKPSRSAASALPVARLKPSRSGSRREQRRHRSATALAEWRTPGHHSHRAAEWRTLSA